MPINAVLNTKGSHPTHGTGTVEEGDPHPQVAVALGVGEALEGVLGVIVSFSEAPVVIIVITHSSKWLFNNV